MSVVCAIYAETGDLSRECQSVYDVQTAGKHLWQRIRSHPVFEMLGSFEMFQHTSMSSDYFLCQTLHCPLYPRSDFSFRGVCRATASLTASDVCFRVSLHSVDKEGVLHCAAIVISSTHSMSPDIKARQAASHCQALLKRS